MKFFDLFAGIGGFHLGMSGASHMCVGACEVDERARQIYRHQFPYTDIYDDVREIDGSELPEIDCITAGFPCQPFSLVGSRGGFDEPGGDLFFEVIRIAKKTRCKFLFLENVPGLLYLDGGKYFHRVLSTLDDNGYDAQWQVISSQYHTGQSRQRLFIIAYLRSDKECRPKIFPFTHAEQVVYGQVARERIIKNNNNNNKTTTTTTTKTITQEPNNNNIIIPISQFGFVGKDSTKKISIRDYGEPAYTIMANKRPLVMTYQQQQQQQQTTTTRYATPIEAERLQGFPDNWTRYGKKKDDYLRKEMSDSIRYFCLGNAVTTDVVTMIGNRLTTITKNQKNTNKNKTDKIWVQ